MDDATERRKAQNEAVFRDANERIEEARQELDLLDGRTPFLCECDDTACRAVIRLTRAEYERVRSRPTWFLVADEHVPDTGGVAERGDGYAIVEKQGAAAEVAEDTDPRS